MSSGKSGGTDQAGDKLDRRLSAATLERLGYEHSPSVRERQEAALQLTRRRMSEQDVPPVAGTAGRQTGDEVELVEELARGRPTVAEMEELRRVARRERRRLRKERKEEEARAEAARQLELTAKRLYFWGFFLLPILWLVYLIYFNKEHRTSDANANIKKSELNDCDVATLCLTNDVQCTSES